MKPNELNLTLDQNRPIQQPQSVILLQTPLIIDNSLFDVSSQTNTTQLQPTSPATEALEFLRSDIPSTTNMEESIDPQSLIIDLNDLLRRDPTLSTLDTDKFQPTQAVNVATMNTMNRQGVAIPGTKDDKSAMLKLEETSDLFNEFLRDQTSTVGLGVDSVGMTTTTSSSGGVVDHGSSFGSISPCLWNQSSGQQMQHDGNQLTLTQLNSPTEHDIGLSCSGGGVSGASGGVDASSSSMIKMEVNDFDDLDLFLTNSSPNVSFGLQHELKPTTFQPAVKQEPLQTRPIGSYTPLINPNFWQANTDEMIFGNQATVSSAPSSGLLSSSVPTIIPSPLSDILTELNPATARSPNSVSDDVLPPLTNDPSPSQVGPTRHSTLHRLLMQRKSDNVAQAGAGGSKTRPSPVRSPEARKTLDQMRTSLSTSNPPLMLSRSAPTSIFNPSAAAAGGDSSRNVWARREPRQHINSVCSVGDTSSIADEVNDVLSGLSPSDDLQDIASDDEDGGGYFDKDTSDDESDTEGTSPSLAKLSTSAGSSSGGGKKAERHFWQYNVQAKGPKGQKINIETKMEDPHVLNDIVDPVFSGDVQLQGIKHSGKARRGDGNDLTPNPRKLAAIGKELDHLSRIINDMTPVSEMPFGARCKSRKEKNKLASRACRLKKKAQHEANKVKCAGLLDEHRDLSESIRQVKEMLAKKVDINCTIPQPELTANIDQLVERARRKKIAGNTTAYVNDQITRNLPYV